MSVFRDTLDEALFACILALRMITRGSALRNPASNFMHARLLWEKWGHLCGPIDPEQADVHRTVQQGLMVLKKICDCGFSLSLEEQQRLSSERLQTLQRYVERVQLD